MRALKTYISALLVVTVMGGLLPLPAMAHRITERVYDPSTGETYRRSVPHRHLEDGTIEYLDDSSYTSSSYYSNSYAPSYSSYYSSPYYSSSSYRPYGYSSYYRPYGYSSDYGDGYGSHQSGVGPALLGAGIGYAIGRSRR